MTQGTVTKTGNSYAIRVPKSYITAHGLKLGDKVPLAEPLAQQEAAIAALVAHAKKQKAPLIEDPVAWQRAQRKATDPWDEVR